MAWAERTVRADGRSASTLALIANPASGTCDPDEIAARLRSFGAELECFGIEEIQGAVDSGADRVVIAGGDGSIAPVAAAAGKADLALALVPAGTANDFARRLGLPLQVPDACRLAVQGMRLKALELGWMVPLAGGRRPFVNVASAWLPAPAARQARAWKRALGPVGYAAGALVAGFTARAVPCQVDCGEQPLFAGDAWQVTLAASGAFGAGSGIQEADPLDGELEVVAVARGPRPGLVALAYRLRSGRLTRHRRARHARCASAEVRAPEGTEFNVDGEVVEVGPARFEAEGGAFRLVTG
jgi:diacylglycerol kinase family enzyme